MYDARCYRRCGWRQSAFTLIEVLVALALVAIILPAVMKGISLATATASLAKRKMAAVSLAETQLAELLVSGEWQNGDLSGDFGEEWPVYRWTAEVTNWEESSFREVRVSVTWTARGAERSVTLATLAHLEDG